MALGAYLGPPLATTAGSMSSMLSSASLPAVTTLAMALASGYSSGAKAAYTAPVMPAVTAAGAHNAGHDGQWFDRIHVIPREVALGNITNDRVLEVEVWNAHRKGFKLYDVVVAGNPGVSLDSVIPVIEFGTLHSEIHVVTVQAAGSEAIDNVVTWVFRTRTGAATYVLVSTPGADLTLSGSRMLLFTARPNGTMGIRERYGYPTDVITSWDETEQRVQLRENPRREQRFVPTLVDPADTLELMSKIYLAGGAPFAVPLWPDVTPLTAAVSSGATAVYFDTAGRQFVAGGNAMLWRDQHTFEAFSILSVAAGHVVVDGTITLAFAAAGTQVVPMLPMRLLEAAPISREGGDVAVLELAFSQEGA